jgi:hypothetical protein
VSGAAKEVELGQRSSTSPALTGGTPGGTAQTLDDVVKPIGLFMTDDHRYYWNGKGPLPSVTTALGIIHKEALVQWIKWGIATAAVDYAEWLPLIIEQIGYSEARSWMAATPDEVRDKAASIGISVHVLADMLSRGHGTGTEGFEVPEWQIPYAKAYLNFLDRYSASSIVSSEKSVLGLEDGYAGTYDLLLQIDGELWLLDIKTSKGYYPEFALQLAAYAHAESIALPDDPVLYPMPRIQRTGIVHLRPDLYTDTGWRLIEYPTTDRDYVAFLAALDLYQWKGEGRFTKSILQKAIVSGEVNRIRSDPLTEES